VHRGVKSGDMPDQCNILPSRHLNRVLHHFVSDLTSRHRRRRAPCSQGLQAPFTCCSRPPIAMGLVDPAGHDLSEPFR
jgi:hypothetical protein